MTFKKRVINYKLYSLVKTSDSQTIPSVPLLYPNNYPFEPGRREGSDKKGTTGGTTTYRFPKSQTTVLLVLVPIFSRNFNYLSNYIIVGTILTYKNFIIIITQKLIKFLLNDNILP